MKKFNILKKKFQGLTDGNASYDMNTCHLAELFPPKVLRVDKKCIIESGRFYRSFLG